MTMYPLYKPLPDYVTIRESPIAGLGLFATKKIPAGTYIGIVHVMSDNHPEEIRDTLNEMLTDKGLIYPS